jgi:DNA-binding beta-propeller fold protein YncE
LVDEIGRHTNWIALRLLKVNEVTGGKFDAEEAIPFANDSSVIKSVLVGMIAAATVAHTAEPNTLGYAQPAEHTTVGPTKQLPGVTVLPSGRLSSPAGLHAVFDGSIVAAATDPTGKRLVLAIRHAEGVRVSVLDAHSLHELSHADLSGTVPGGGLVVLRDPTDATRSLVGLSMGAGNAVDFLDLQADGQLAPDAVPTVQLAATSQGHFIGQLAAAPRNELVFAVDEIAGTVTSIDVRKRQRIASTNVGLAPHGVAVDGHTLVVTNEGMIAPAALSAVAPQYAAALLDLDRANSVSLIHFAQSVAAPGILETAIAVPLDPSPHGVLVGGAHPTAITGAGRYLYIALSAVDRIAVLDTSTGKIAGGTELRFFDKGPYGTGPVSLALDTKRHRLYAALAGANAVAVLDVMQPLAPHRLGLIPTANIPNHLIFNPVTASLYIASERGFGMQNASIEQRIDVTNPDLAPMTRTTLRNLRRVVTITPTPPATRVVQIRMPAASFDEVFGPHARFDASVMPILHQLAHRNALASNLYSEANGPLSAEQFALAGQATPYTLRTEALGTTRRWEGPQASLGPDDSPRFGYLFDMLTRGHIRYRNYGALTAMHRYSYSSDSVYAAALASGRADACATEFVRDQAAAKGARFLEVVLPDVADGDATVAAQAADSALGTIVNALGRDPQWAQTTVIISPWQARGVDHIDARRTYAVIIAPHGRKVVLGNAHRSVTGLLKTEETLLGIEPMMLGDLLSTPIQFVNAGESGSNG